MDSSRNSWVVLAVFGFLALLYLVKRDSGIQDVSIHTLGDECECGRVENVLNVNFLSIRL